MYKNLIVTSESKKPGQFAAVIHYCELSRFFLTQTLCTAIVRFFMHQTLNTIQDFVHVGHETTNATNIGNHHLFTKT